jgi:predicted nucleic acid-binding protein
MKVQRIYLETTIFNYLFEPERDAHQSTVDLFREIRGGKFDAYTSAYVFDELSAASEPKRSQMLGTIPQYKIKVLETDTEAERLANEYVKECAIPKTHLLDATHIALASIKEMDIIISLNFKHINKRKTEILTVAINKKNGYNKEIAICSPMEVIENDSNEK